MPRPLFDSPYLYGLHDPGGEQIMAQRGAPGWIHFTEELGNDPDNKTGSDYRPWSDQGFGILARLNNGYEPNGTIPHSDRYERFAQRCANYVASSPGCRIWVIGNEPNHPVERPGVQLDWSVSPPRVVSPGEVILQRMYARCYQLCRDAIKDLAGHADDQVIVGAVAPWNAITTYPGNEKGDWVQYLTDICTALATSGCDGIAIHAYTHGSDPRLVYQDSYMQAPFQNRQFNFRVYQDFLRGIPASMRHLPVYLTETDQDEAWNNQNSGWVQRVYGEVDWWNHQPGNQTVRAVVLFRWPKGLDRWGIDGKEGVIEDFRAALQQRYVWPETAPA